MFEFVRDKGVKGIFEGFKTNNSLEVFNLMKIVRQLVKDLKLAHHLELNLCFNAMRDEGVRLIADSLRTNRTLKGDLTTEEGKTMLSEINNSNKELIVSY
jgi:hypothetical protein